MAKDDAVLHLSGERENIVGLDATHSEICRFNPALAKDRAILEMVQVNLNDLYEKAIEGQGETTSVDEALAQVPEPLNLPDDQKDLQLRERLNRLRD